MVETNSDAVSGAVVMEPIVREPIVPATKEPEVEVAPAPKPVVVAVDPAASFKLDPETGARIPIGIHAGRMSSNDIRDLFKKQKKTTIRIPKTKTEKDDVYVNVCGYLTVIRRGDWVDVPAGVLAVLNDAEASTLTQEDSPNHTGMVSTIENHRRIPYEVKLS